MVRKASIASRFLGLVRSRVVMRRQTIVCAKDCVVGVRRDVGSR